MEDCSPGMQIFQEKARYGLPLPPRLAGGWAVENERSASALRAHTSSREAGKHGSQSAAVRSSQSVILTPFSLHVLMYCTFGLPPNAPRALSALSAWLRVQLFGSFFSSRILYKSTMTRSLGDSTLGTKAAEYGKELLLERAIPPSMNTCTPGPKRWLCSGPDWPQPVF